MQHFKSAFAGICRTDQPRGTGEQKYVVSIFHVLNTFKMSFFSPFIFRSEDPDEAGGLIMRINHDGTSLKSRLRQKGGFG